MGTLANRTSDLGHVGLAITGNSSHFGPDYETFSTPEKWILTTILSAVILFTVAGNLLTIVCVIRDKSLHSVSYAYIASLAFADLIVGSIVMPFSTLFVITFDGVWVFGSVLCDLWQFMDYVGCTASLTNLCAIALDRYQTVSQPLRAMRTRTRGRVALTLLITWLIPFVHWIVLFSVLRSLNGNPPQNKCSLDWKPTFTVLIASTIIIYIPIITTLVLFVMIFMSLRMHSVRLTRRLCRRSFHYGTPDSQSTVPFLETRASTGSDVSNDTPTLTTKDDVYSACCGLFMSRDKSEDTRDLDVISERTDADSDDVFMFIFCDSRWEYISYRTVATNTSPQLSRQGFLKDAATNTSPDFPLKRRSLNSPPLSRAKSDPSMFGEIPRIKHIGKAPSVLPHSAWEINRINTGEKNKVQQDKWQNRLKIESKFSAVQKTRYQSPAGRMRKSHSETVENVRLAQQIRAARNLAVLMTFLVLCWMPFSIMWPIHAYCPSCLTPKIYNLSFWINYLNSSMNPIIYCLLNPNIRSAFRRFLTRS